MVLGDFSVCVEVKRMDELVRKGYKELAKEKFGEYEQVKLEQKRRNPGRSPRKSGQTGGRKEKG